MAKKAVFQTPDGKRYMITSVAADLFGLNKSTVAKYCADGRIAGAFKDSSGKWCIPFDAIKPMTKSDIRKVLLVTVKLKNDSKIKLDYSEIHNKLEDMRKIYQYLADIGYIESSISEIQTARLPFDVVLTKKAIVLVDNIGGHEEENKKSIDNWTDIVNSIIKLIQITKNLLS